MPYIKENRVPLATKVYGAQNSGELNFSLTNVFIEYHKRLGGRYAQINDVLGAIEGAKLEFYRRVAAPYEDGKIKENGDVF